MLNRTSLKLSSTACWLTMSYPTGWCIQALANTIQNMLICVPMATSQMLASRTHRGRRSLPNHHSAMKVLSRKNAISTSSASGTPKMLPTKREYSLQFMPNWNSCTIPVTTPTAKLIKKRWPKKFARLS